MDFKQTICYNKLVEIKIHFRVNYPFDFLNNISFESAKKFCNFYMTNYNFCSLMT